MYEKNKKVFNLSNGSKWKITLNNDGTFNIEQSETEGFKNFKIKSNNIFELNEIYTEDKEKQKYNISMQIGPSNCW